MAGIRLFEEQLRLNCPLTFVALQKLVMAMEDVHKNTGKTSWLGKDKGREAFDHFFLVLRGTIKCMILDGVIAKSAPPEIVLRELIERLNWFAMAFPNWPRAYEFSAHFFRSDSKGAIVAIEGICSVE